METRYLRAFLEMLPRLQAEEAMLGATQVAVGTGSTKDGPKILREWQKLISKGQPRKQGTVRELMQAMGVKRG